MAKHSTSCCACGTPMEVEISDTFMLMHPARRDAILKAATCELCIKSPERRKRLFMERQKQTPLPYEPNKPQ